MIVDTSALIAILRGEPEADIFLEALANSGGDVSISTATILEAHIVVQRMKIDGLEERLTELVDNFSLMATPFTEDHLAIAVEAYRKYGRGSGHAAGLNFGDCFAYALAAARGEPLLFKGDDFAATDVGVVG